jgi:N-acylneuraminate cytidylyltransferase
MRCIAIIPARGGSKRIPKKNIKDFLGKPIIAYSIAVAIESELFDEVMVSTDDQEIAKVAERYQAKVPFIRSAKNSDDYATTANVITEVLDSYKKHNQYFDYACCIYPTAPLITSASLKNAFNLLRSLKYNTVFPVAAFNFPIWRSLELKDGKIDMFWPENRDKRSQDLPKAWHDAGQFYWINVPAFCKEPLLYSSNSGSIELTSLEVQDIDTIADWKMAELKAQLLK